MRRPQIVVLGYSEAAMLLRKLDPRLLSGVISIHGAREFGVEAPGIPRLDLVFDDVDVPVAGDHVAEYHARQTRQARQEMGLKEVPPQGRTPKPSLILRTRSRQREAYSWCIAVQA